MSARSQTLLVIGSTGYLGSVAAEHLTKAGHRVVALNRRRPDQKNSEQTNDDQASSDVELRFGDLADPASLAAAVTDEVDGVLHFAPPTGDADSDHAAIEALLAPLRGTGRLLMYVSGVWVLGATGPHPIDEDASANPIDLVSYRPELERQVLDAVQSGVRGVVVRPGVVHGRGKGIPAMMVEWAAAAGQGRYVGDAAVRWPMVHVEDLADLVVAVVERAAPGLLLHAVAESAVPVVELAHAAARAAGVAGAQTWPVQQAREVLGVAFAEALALDQAVAGDRARQELGWRPRRPGAVMDVAAGDRHGPSLAAA